MLDNYVKISVKIEEEKRYKACKNLGFSPSEFDEFLSLLKRHNVSTTSNKPKFDYYLAQFKLSLDKRYETNSKNYLAQFKSPKDNNISSIKDNTFTDPRDGQEYKTIKLKDGKTWMAQNLNFDVGEGCLFYDNDYKNGEKYGRLYTWEAAQKACPEGWRLPTDDEWWEMTKHYGMTRNDYDGQQINEGENGGVAAYKALIDIDSSNFDALLGGYRYSDGSFGYLGVYGGYWSSTENDSSDAWSYYFSSNSKNLSRYYYSKSLGRSCRCLQDYSAI